MLLRVSRRSLAAVAVLAAIASSSRAPVGARQTTDPAANPAAGSQPATDFERLFEAAQQAYRRHDPDAASAAYARLRDRASAEDAALWQARGQLGLGIIATDRLRYAEAVPLLRQALDTIERVGGPSDVGAACLALSRAMSGGGSAVEARALLARAIDAFDRAHDVPAKLHAQLDRARLAPDAEADAVLAALVADAHAAGNRAIEGAALHTWGDRWFNRGELDRALHTLDAAVAVLIDGVDPEELGTTYNSLGRLYRVHGQLAVALRYQLAALAIHEKIGTAYVHIQSLNAVAATYQILGDFAQARVYFARALEQATRGSAPAIVAFLRASYGDLLVRMGDVARGRALIAQALNAAVPYYRTLRGRQLAGADARLGHWSLAAQEIDEAISHCVRRRAWIASGRASSEPASRWPAVTSRPRRRSSRRCSG
jgi:tetratricopeptide (TPR) repeat protein